MRAMTLRLPDEVHEALRREAFESRRSMNEIVVEALGTNRAALWDEGFVASETHKGYVAMEDQPWRVTHPKNPYRGGSK